MPQLFGGRSSAKEEIATAAQIEAEQEELISVVVDDDASDSDVVQVVEGMDEVELQLKPRQPTCMSTTLQFMGCQKRPPFVVEYDDGMDDSTEVWPEVNANFISKLTFSWVGSLLYKGWQQPLQHRHIWQLAEKDSASSIHEKYALHWSKDQPSLLKALHHAFGLYFYAAAIPKLLYDILNFVGPLVLGWIITYLDSDDDPIWYGIMLAGVLLVTYAAKALLINQYFHIGFRTGMHLRSAVVTAVYEKALVLSNAAKQDMSTGAIVDLMSNDAQRLLSVTAYLHILWSGPFQILIALVLLFRIIGLATIAGVLIMLLLIPVNSVIVKQLKKIRASVLKHTDERVKWTNEILQGIRAVKLYGYERKFIAKVEAIRSAELQRLMISRLVRAINVWISYTSPVLVCVVSLTAYVLLGNTLTAAVAFPAITLFNLLRFPLNVFPNMVSSAAEVWVSIKRLREFLTSDEVKPLPRITNIEPFPNGDAASVLLKGNFSWDMASSQQTTLRNMDIKLRYGDTAAVTGRVGSGKSSLICALLGELETEDGEIGLIGTIALVPQQAWVINATLRDNILFGKPYDEDKYQKVLEACALLPDLDQLMAGDMTEIGEKGINLSGGQKQRVSIARAVYQDTDIVLMDDPLSAVDAHVAAHLFKNVVKGLLKDKTVVLVTHHLHVLHEVDHIITMTNGEAVEQGSYDELMANQGAFSKLIEEFSAMQNQEEEVEEVDLDLKSSTGSALTSPLRPVDSPARPDPSPARSESAPVTKEAETDGALIESEERDVGAVKLRIYLDYARSGGLFLFALIILGYLAAQFTRIGTDWWISYWSGDAPGPDDPDAEPAHSIEFYLGIYVGWCILNSLIVLITQSLVAVVAIRSAKTMHNRLLHNIMRVPMAFFETTPIGRILNRFAKDTDSIDVSLPDSLASYLNTLITCLGTLVVVLFVTPLALIGMLPILYLYWRVQQYYRASSRELKRLDSISKSPIFAHFSETLSGLSSIRAYDAGDRFISMNEEKLDHNQRAYFAMVSANRWLNIRLEAISTSIVFLAAFMVVIDRGIDPSLAGLALSYAFSTTGWMSWLVRSTAEVEQNMNSAERVLFYSGIERECEVVVIRDNDLDPRWPMEGKIEFQNALLRYRPDLPPALNNVNMTIKAREKIGVCGRTGAGKSSLLAAMFRLVELYSGAIFIDDVNIADVSLEKLRTHLAIIPQDPVLFTGTVRSNLDPFDEHSDEDVWRALEMVQLKATIEGMEEQLNTRVAEMGLGFSVGQRQLMCFARALLGHVSVLFLDEATASCDIETDKLIQETLRTSFAHCTVVTIAHRLNTIMDSDRILVMSAGKLEEFDTPYALLSDTSSALYSMVEDTGDSQFLMNIAYEKHLRDQQRDSSVEVSESFE